MQFPVCLYPEIIVNKQILKFYLVLSQGTWTWIGNQTAHINDATWLSDTDKQLNKIATQTGVSFKLIDRA